MEKTVAGKLSKAKELIEENRLEETVQLTNEILEIIKGLKISNIDKNKWILDTLSLQQEAYLNLKDYFNGVRVFRLMVPLLEEQNENQKILDLSIEAFNSSYILSNYDDAVYFARLSLKAAELTKNEEAIIQALITLGSGFYLLSNYSEALIYLNKSVEMALKADSKQQLVDIYSWIGHVYKELANYDKAEENYQSALSVSEPLMDVSATVNCYENLIMLLNRTGNFREAHNYTERAIQMAKLNNLDVQLSFLYSKKTSTLVGIGQYDLALAYLNKSEALGYKLDLAETLVEKNLSRGVLFREMGKFDKSVPTFDKELQIAEQNNNESSIASCNYHIGYVKYLKGDAEGAESHLARALELDMKQGYEYEVGSDYYVLGLVSQDRMDYSLAAEYFQKSIQQYETTQDIIKITDAYLAMGKLLFEQAEPDKAWDYYVKVNQLMPEVKNELKRSHYFLSIGCYQAEREEFFYASKNIQYALDYYIQTKDTAGCIFCFFKLGAVEMMRNNLTEAVRFFSCLQQYSSLAAELFFTAQINLTESRVSRQKLLDQLVQAADLCRNYNTGDTAEYLLRIAAMLALNLGDSKQYFELKKQQAKQLIGLKMFDEAACCIDDITDYLSTLPDENNADQENWLEELKHETSKGIKKKWPSNQFRANALFNYGNELQLTFGACISALDYYRKAEEIALHNQEEVLFLPEIYRAIANANLELELHETALDNYQKAAHLHIDKEEYSFAEIALDGIIACCDVLEKPDTALEAMLKLKQCFEKRDKTYKIAHICSRIGKIYEQKGLREEALLYYNTAYKLAKELKDNDLIVSVHNRIGSFYSLAGKHKKAIKEHVIAEKLSRKWNLGLIHANSCHFLANELMDINKEKHAKRFYDRAFARYLEVAENEPSKEDATYCFECASILIENDDDERFAELQFAQSDYLFRFGYYNEAFVSVDSAITMLAEEQYPLYYAKLKRLQGRINLMLDAVDEAVEQLKDALEYSQLQHDMDDMIWNSYYLGEAMLANGRTSNGITYIFQSLTWAEAIENEKYIAFIQNNLAIELMEEDRDSEAVELLHKSMLWAEKQEDSKQVIMRLKNLLIAYNKTADTDNELKYTLKYISIIEEQNDRPSLARAFYQLHSLYRMLGKSKESDEALDKAVEFSEGEPVNSDTVAFYNDLSISFAENDEFEKSIAILEKAKSMLKNSDDIDHKALVSSNLSLRYRSEKEYEKAYRALSESLNLYLSDLDEYNVSRIYIEMGDLFIEMNNFTDGEYALLQSIYWADKVDEPSLRFRALKQTGILYLQNEKFKEGKKYLLGALDETHKLDDRKNEVSVMFLLANLCYAENELKDMNDWLVNAKNVIENHGWQDEFPEVYMLDEKLEEPLDLDDSSNGDAVTFRPASDFDIDNCINDMFDSGCIVPPNEYFEFLKETNGLIHADKKLYGTSRNEKLPSLLEVNSDKNRPGFLHGKSVLGELTGIYVLYDSELKKYLLTEKSSGMQIKEFENIKGLKEELNM